MIKIAIIGSGNVAWHLAINIEKYSNHVITYVTSRNFEAAEELCDELYEASLRYDMDFSALDVDIVLVAVADKALKEVALKLKVKPQTIVAHTSGSGSISLLANFDHHGVFYPLQTFSKGAALDITKVPFCIEASDTSTEERLIALAKSMSTQVQAISTAQRSILHVAAVIACNFTNHLFAQAKEVLDKENIDFQILKPLIKETVAKALDTDPYKAQTGPARRNDQNTIKQHLAFLGKGDDLKAPMYKLITQSIIDNY